MIEGEIMDGALVTLRRYWSGGARWMEAFRWR